MNFWQQIDADLDRIEAEQPTTYAHVADILKGQTEPGISAAPAFFAGGGGDRSLFSALSVAGWRRTWAEADYYYVATHPDTGETLTYVEGDVYPGDVANR
jgi:hypothetical protein